MGKTPKFSSKVPRPRVHFSRFKETSVSRTGPFPDKALGASGLSFPFGRPLLVGTALILGFYLIYTHQTLNHTLTGFALWIIAIILSLAWFPPVPGVKIFPMTQAPEPDTSGDWSVWKITLVAGGVLAALGLSDYFLGKANAALFLFSLLALGWGLTFIENHHWGMPENKPLKAVSVPGAAFPWAPLVILLFGTFFLFHHKGFFPKGYGPDSIKTLELAQSCMAGYTTPYVDAWGQGNNIFSYFMMGMFFKAVGCSFPNGELFTALLNLAGYLFFYGFIRFYLPKAPALAATLFFCASHWILYAALEITGARGMLLPFECATLYFFARALEKGKARDYVLFGSFLAFSLMSTILGWILLTLFILTLLVLWARQPFAFQGQKKSWVLALCVALLWFSPMVIHDHTYNCYWFPIGTFGNDITGQGPKFFNLWRHAFSVLQMFNIGSQEYLMEMLPFLSPWEGLIFLAGLGWCLRRFFKVSHLLIILGLLGGLAPSVLTNTNITLRSLAAAPFIFLLMGIGLDRLTRILVAPLGHRGKGWRLVIGGVFLALSMGWQYDILFNQLPRFKDIYWTSGRIYSFATITAKHLEGWDTYVDIGDGTWQHPENDYFYSRADMEKGQRIIFRPDLPSLPLKNIPTKGALILFPDQLGEAFRDWIRYYYPSAREQDILNPFGDVDFRLWEINPSQIQEALKRPEPGEGMTLSWFDAKNRKLGQWQIPTFSEKLLNEEWFAPCPGKAAFPWGNTAYFVVQGYLKNPAGKVLALEANGKVDGFIGGQKVQLDGRDPAKRLQVPQASRNQVAFEIRYFPPKEGGFHLDLLEKTPQGWDMIPSSELNF